MKSSGCIIPPGLDRVNTLFAWWGMPNFVDTSEMEARARQFQAIVEDLSKLFNEASSSQVRALSAANEQFSCALHELPSARQPPELMAAQSKLVTGLMRSLAVQTKAWAELTQKLHACCSAVVRDAAIEVGEDTDKRAA